MSDQEVTDAWVKTPVRFFLETVTSICLFLIIGSAAVGLNFCVLYLQKNNIDQVIIYGLKFAEYSLFIADLVLFGRFLWVTVQKTWRDL